MKILLLSLFAFASSYCAQSDKYKELVAAVEEGRHKELAKILRDPSVDPSFNDHQLIRESEFIFGAKTTKHLLLDHRFDPSAYENMFLKNAFENGNIYASMLLLAHPKVDPHCIEDLVPVNSIDYYSELQEMMSTLNGRHISVREGREIDTPQAMTIHAIIVLLFSAILNGRDDHTRRLLPLSRYFKVSLPFDIALCFNHEVIGRVALEMNQKFNFKMSQIRFLCEFIGRLRNWKADKSLDLIMEQIMKKDETLKRLIAELYDPQSITKNRAADKLYQHSLRTYGGDDFLNIRSYLTHLAATAIFKHYVALPQELLAELVDCIIKSCL